MALFLGYGVSPHKVLIILELAVVFTWAFLGLGVI